MIINQLNALRVAIGRRESNIRQASHATNTDNKNITNFII